MSRQTGRFLSYSCLSKTILFSAMVVGLAACHPFAPEPTATPTPMPTKTALPTSTGTPEPTNTSIRTPVTATETPSKTSTPRIPATPTSKPPDQILTSPNEEFIAEFENAYSHPAFTPQIIKIFDRNGSLLLEIPYQHEVTEVDPHPVLTIYGWSKDSNYLYFCYQFGPDGGGFAFWWDGFDLQRINVRSGNIEQVIPGKRKGFVAFAFSPDETQIAYTRAQDHPSIIFIHNLSTGAEKKAKVIPSKDYVRVGNIYWSSSGDEIAFQTEADDYAVQTIYLDLSTMKQKVVREYMVDECYFQGWSEDGNLEFVDFQNGAYIIHVNPKSEETIIIGTLTPQ